MPLKTMSEHDKQKSHFGSEMVASLFLRTSMPGKAFALGIKAYILPSFAISSNLKWLHLIGSKHMGFLFSYIPKPKASLAFSTSH